ncbi:virulence-associated E family protein [Phocaeicola vulgatus]|nr:virulence-associated E family protein [Phocaeicola vulgatus]
MAYLTFLKKGTRKFVNYTCHWRRLTDHIENSLWCAMQHHGMAVNLNEPHTPLGSDFVKEYHPLREYLDGLPPWDGETDYIGRLAAMVHVKESPHSPLQQDKSRERNDLSETPVRFADILKRWMVSMIAAALDETVVNQVILTLIGRQGSYKTSFMQAYSAARIVRILHHKEQL